MGDPIQVPNEFRLGIMRRRGQAEAARLELAAIIDSALRHLGDEQAWVGGTAQTTLEVLAELRRDAVQVTDLVETEFEWAIRTQPERVPLGDWRARWPW
jgi:ribosome biogenesis SPOUT family RNA methylase Rps3